MGSEGCVDYLGEVCLAGASPPARFGRPVMVAPPCSVSVSLTCGAWLSVRRKEKNSEILYLLILNSAKSLEICFGTLICHEEAYIKF